MTNFCPNQPQPNILATHIRQATSSDISALQQCAKQTFRDTYPTLMEQYPSSMERFLESTFSFDSFAKELATPQSRYFVIIQDDIETLYPTQSPPSSPLTISDNTQSQINTPTKHSLSPLILGYAKVNWGHTQTWLQFHKAKLNYLQIQRFYITSTHHNQRLGHKLLSFITKFALQMQFTAMWLAVWIENVKAQGFYQHMGFSFVPGEMTEFMVEKQPFVDLIMICDLRPFYIGPNHILYNLVTTIPHETTTVAACKTGGIISHDNQRAITLLNQIFSPCARL